MKVSNKILVITGAAIVVVVLSLIIASRVFVVDLMNREFPADGVVITSSSDRSTQIYDVSGFNGVSSSGAWAIEVRKSDGYKVELTVPEGVAEYLIVERSGDTLTLGTTKPVKLPDESAMKAVIWAPGLSTLSTTGYADVQIVGFSGGDLELSGAGVVTFHSRNGSFESLSIDFEGVGSFDLRDTSVTDADIVIHGISDVELTMDGGTLSGKIDIGSLKYRGRVENLTVKGGQVSTIERVK